MNPAFSGMAEYSGLAAPKALVFSNSIYQNPEYRPRCRGRFRERMPAFDRTEKGWKAEAVVIGPAGENRVRFSVVENDYWRSAGRTGTGAVMGAKGIKAIMFTGNRKRSIYDRDAVTAISRQLSTGAKDSPAVQNYNLNFAPGIVTRRFKPQ